MQRRAVVGALAIVAWGASGVAHAQASRQAADGPAPSAQGTTAPATDPASPSAPGARPSPAAGRDRTVAALPLFWWSQRKDQRTFAAPLLLFGHQRSSDKQTTVVGPIFHSADPTGSSTGVFPLYGRFHDRTTQGTTHILFPLLAWHHRPGTRLGVFGPAFGWSSPRGWGAGLAPLFFFGRSGARRHAMLLPLFFHRSDRERGTSLTALGPFFGRRIGKDYDGGVVPLLFFGRHADRRYLLIPPLFWHFGSKEGTTDVLGPFYVQRGRRGWGFGLAPLLFVGKQGSKEHQVVLPPLFIRVADRAARTSKLLAGPFFHARNGDTTTDVLFPLFALRRSPGRSFFVSPLGGWRSDRDRGTTTAIVGPYVYRRDDRRRTRTHALFPLFLSHRSPDYDLTAQLPLFWRVRDGKETNTVVFPLWWSRRSPERSTDVFFPLAFGRDRTARATTTVVGPVWNVAERDGGRALGVFPLFAYRRRMNEGQPSSWFGAPLIYHRRDARSGARDLVVGPYFDLHRPDGYRAGFFPLAFAWRRGTTSTVVTPLYYRRADSAAGKALNVLGPLYWGHRPGRREGGLFPLFFGRFRDDGTASVFAFPFAYYKSKPKGGSVLATALFGWSSYPKGKRVWVGPLYVRRDADWSSGALWPVFYHGRSRHTGARTSFLFPLFLDARRDDGRELQAYSPLVWRHRTIERSTIVGLPLFFDSHAYGESRTTGFLPLFIRHRSHVNRSSSWFFPALLTWGRTRWGEDPGRDLVIFPLVWRFGGKRSTTVVAPLYWDFKRGSNRTTVAFPIFARWVRPDGERLLVLNMYYRKGLGPRAGTWHTNIFPLVSFGRPRPGDLEWYVLEGLFGYARQGRARRLRLFWFLDVPLQPLPASALNWFGSTPASARTELF